MTADVTPEQQAACLKAARRCVEYANVNATCEVRLEPAWTDPETGERFPSSWVCEVRVRRAASYVVVTVEVADYVRGPGAWCELLDGELRAAVGRRR